MIRLSANLKCINRNKLSRIKVIAKQLRIEYENLYDWQNNKNCFRDTCNSITEELKNKINNEGIYSYKVNGLYYGASKNYEPDMKEWDENEKQEYFNSEHTPEPFGFTHWWVVADNKYIVDITQDQFFPGEEDEHRVIITTIGDEMYGS